MKKHTPIIVIFLLFSTALGLFYYQARVKIKLANKKPDMAPFYHWADSLLTIEKRKSDSLTFAIKLKDLEIQETKKYYEKKLRSVPNWNHDSIMVFFATRAKNKNNRQ